MKSPSPMLIWKQIVLIFSQKEQQPQQKQKNKQTKNSPNINSKQNRKAEGISRVHSQISVATFDKLTGKYGLILSSSPHSGAVLLCKVMLIFHSHSERQKKRKNHDGE